MNATFERNNNFIKSPHFTIIIGGVVCALCITSLIENDFSNIFNSSSSEGENKASGNSAEHTPSSDTGNQNDCPPFDQQNGEGVRYVEDERSYIRAIEPNGNMRDLNPEEIAQCRNGKLDYTPREQTPFEKEFQNALKEARANGVFNRN